MTELGTLRAYRHVIIVYVYPSIYSRFGRRIHKQIRVRFLIDRTFESTRVLLFLMSVSCMIVEYNNFRTGVIVIISVRVRSQWIGVCLIIQRLPDQYAQGKPISCVHRSSFIIHINPELLIRRMTILIRVLFHFYDRFVIIGNGPYYYYYYYY